MKSQQHCRISALSHLHKIVSPSGGALTRIHKILTNSPFPSAAAPNVVKKN